MAGARYPRRRSNETHSLHKGETNSLMFALLSDHDVP